MPLADKNSLHIPHPTWAKDKDVDEGGRDFENWKELERWADRLPTATPLPFHWPGQVDQHIDVRNGPGEFRSDGRITKIRYRWDTPAAAGATVEWKLDGTTVGTHTVSNDNPHIERPGWAYGQEAIVAIVTAVGTDASGLSAFVYLDA